MTCFTHVSEAQSVIFAALIAALVGSLSWLGKSAVSAVLWFYGRLSREIEMLVALKAEIETCITSIAVYALADVGAKMKSEIETTPNYKIFAPLDRDYFIFDRLRPDITKLPEAPIREVVKFYDGVGGFDTLLASLQEPRFEGFPAKRRVTYVDYMVQAAAGLVTDGNAAVRALDAERHGLLLKRDASLVALLVAVAGAAFGVWRLLAYVINGCGLGT